jgi:hypothetical protein
MRLNTICICPNCSFSLPVLPIVALKKSIVVKQDIFKSGMCSEL